MGALFCFADAHVSTVQPANLALRTVRPWLWRRTALARVLASVCHVVPDVRLLLAQLVLELVAAQETIELLSCGVHRFREASPLPSADDALSLLTQVARARSSAGAAEPQVAIVICAFDEQEWIGFALHSALTQTEASIDVIVVDDGSQDATTSVVRSFADPRVRVISHSRNRGKAHALRSALGQVRSAWLLELDADDWLEPTAVATLLAAARSAASPTPTLWSGRYQVWRRRRNGYLYRGPVVRSDDNFVSERSARVPVPRFYSTQDLHRFGGWAIDDASGGRLYEDVAMTASYLSAGCIRVLDECLYHRVIHADSVSQRHPFGRRA
ncbi:MAG: glycosyltransferase family 2 protein [Firmicutes bacterium]|nr:glycosyltransferase family 2 protein [Bacillota bacterium]